MTGMRTGLLALGFAFLVGCESSHRPANIERVEIGLSGTWRVSVNNRGEGHYEWLPPMPESGSFKITPQQFNDLVTRLERFRRTSVPAQAEGVKAVLDAKCPVGKPYLGGPEVIWIHWIGHNLDQLYAANLACDWKQTKAQNEEIFRNVRSLPIPGGDADYARFLKQLRSNR